MMFSEDSKKILQQNGWTKDRKIDITQYIDYLENEGYTVFKVARDFLCKFGGMHFDIPIIGFPMMEKAHFDAIIAASEIYIERVQTYEERTGERMIPVGANNFNYTLLLSESGKMYAGFDNLLVFLGNDYKEAIEVLFRHLKKPEISMIKKE